MATPADPLVADAAETRVAATTQDLLANASLEVALREAGRLAEAAPLLPSGTCVYVPSLPARPLELSLPVLAEIRAQGLDPVPHVAARRVGSHAELERFLKEAVRAHGVHRVMLIGGDETEPSGPWRDSLQLLSSGVLRDAGVREIGIAAYPEGHPKIAQDALRAAFERKLELAEEQNLGAYAVTQFSFAPERIVALLADLAARAPDLPVYVGMPGPSDPLALLRYAQRCGVGATRRALSTLGTGIAHLVAHTDPSDQLAAAAHYAAAHDNLVGVHLYSFGGVVRTAQWLHHRMQR
ncbi:MAG: methylenetetrahydrofolate reductase [Burkholderiaceae bacterium]|nr:methylenetetrahydrofolate reductase [Burkholderiaceae bacterium]